MSPSRGDIVPQPTNAEPTTETKANIRSSSALTSAKHNLHYLFSPNSPNAPRPIHLRTRALLRSLHYISVFIFWRIVRYAKYALVGSLVAAVGATAFGGVVSGVGFLLAPPTLLGSIGIGAIWAIGKWGFRRVRRPVTEMGVREVEGSRQGVRQDGQWRDISGPRAVPW
ncbi:hypothetical protein F5884DRAFT_236623 [Xylogone sp. PMI_703]|nr:hypothetical protein F5884DRAFT_236623 [Xylogone sp. PMI_703]